MSSMASRGRLCPLRLYPLQANHHVQQTSSFTNRLQPHRDHLPARLPLSLLQRLRRIYPMRLPSHLVRTPYLHVHKPRPMALWVWMLNLRRTLPTSGVTRRYSRPTLPQTVWLMRCHMLPLHHLYLHHHTDQLLLHLLSVMPLPLPLPFLLLLNSHGLPRTIQTQMSMSLVQT